MPDSIYCTISIGGILSSKLLPDLLKLINDEYEESIDIPISLEELREFNGKFFEFSAGCTQYTNLLDFCKENKLTCFIKITSDYNTSGEIIYTKDGMVEKSFNATNDGDPLLYAYKIKPLFQLLIDYAENGISILPLYLEEEECKELVKDGLKNPENFINIIKKEVNELLPSIPDIPPFKFID